MIGDREATAEQEASASHALSAPLPQARELYPPFWRQTQQIGTGGSAAP